MKSIWYWDWYGNDMNMVKIGCICMCCQQRMEVILLLSNISLINCLASDPNPITKGDDNNRYYPNIIWIGGFQGSTWREYCKICNYLYNFSVKADWNGTIKLANAMKATDKHGHVIYVEYCIQAYWNLNLSKSKLAEILTDHTAPC